MAKNEIIYESRRKGKEARLPIVAELYSKGKSYSKIREEVMARLGLSSYSKATVKKDIDTLLEEWRESRIKDIDLAQTLALERNRQHYEEVREEWERSKEDRTAKSVKRKGFPTKSGEDDEEGGSAIKTAFQERKVTTILGKGNPAYMDLMIRLEDQRAKILGLYAPEKKEITGKDGDPLFAIVGDLDLAKLTTEEKEALLELARKCSK
jgi:hypothetical protein